MRLTRLSTIDSRLTWGTEDWEVLLGLARRGDVDGYISNDASMLFQPREMVALKRTRSMLVLTEAVGHDAVRATGLLVVYLGEIGRQETRSATVFRLRAPPLGSFRGAPGTYIDQLAARLGVPPNQLITRELDAMRDLGAI